MQPRKIISEMDLFLIFQYNSLQELKNTLKMMKDLKIEWMLDYMTPANPSDTALAIVKGGAQRWQRLHYPYMETKT